MAKQGDIAAGTYTGTGAAITVNCGFVPDYVRVVNIEDGDTLWEWFAGMADGTAVATAAAVAPLAENGVTAYAGAAPYTSGAAGSEVMNPGSAPGFIVGTVLSESGKDHGWLAMRASQ